MSETTTLSGTELVRRLLTIVMEEAEKNPAFAKRMVSAIPEGAKITFEKPARSQSKKVFDIAEVNPVVILRQSNAEVLDAKLRNLTVSNLKQIAKGYNLDLPSPARKSTVKKDVLIVGIIEAAHHRINQESAAAAE